MERKTKGFSVELVLPSAEFEAFQNNSLATEGVKKWLKEKSISSNGRTYQVRMNLFEEQLFNWRIKVGI